MKREAARKNNRISLYPLRFEEVIADVLKVNPEPKLPKPKAHHMKSQKKAISKTRA